MLQFGKPLRALEKLLKNGGFPASTDDAHRGFYGTEFRPLGHDGPCVRLYTKYGIGVIFQYNHACPFFIYLTTMISRLDCKRDVRFRAVIFEIETRNAGNVFEEIHATENNELMEQ